jgi:hypothetical protein
MATAANGGRPRALVAAGPQVGEETPMSVGEIVDWPGQDPHDDPHDDPQAGE